MEYVPTCCIVGGVLLAYNGILTAAEIVALHRALNVDFNSASDCHSSCVNMFLRR